MDYNKIYKWINNVECILKKNEKTEERDKFKIKHVDTHIHTKTTEE